ncbi:hypothetical protein HOO54_15525 [Bacillus sp. WMMC1349]|uniref:hypothetical protein n=1 Tax=Bacillus sp. WMMC1349 TaxID=2736254 RepID=UPI001554D5E4|nr:hypothetical protein [Bacillus sp. WMMC1349]NPC93606.1 hypothetical protein [Bacillus sp. WMMC1349]
MQIGVFKYCGKSELSKGLRGEVKATDIGLIYRMLPFVHYETNALCANPFENNPKRIRWFNKKELAAAIEVTPDTLGRAEMCLGIKFLLNKNSKVLTMLYRHLERLACVGSK